MADHNGRYILIGQTPVPCEDLFEWARWFETSSRHVALTAVGSARISTVFLGLDHNYFRPGNPPLLFETMVFCDGDDPADEIQERCSAWTEAEIQHKGVVAGMLAKYPGTEAVDMMAACIDACIAALEGRAK